ncbi:hypothetical protein VTN31DRAFT_1618 [Thermomyces dupontii]|uniref:uncharacterized protein n=1 Tax=Talaromyces thermophilus TaxID=28565 RepID=UPI0037425D2E
MDSPQQQPVDDGTQTTPSPGLSLPINRVRDKIRRDQTMTRFNLLSPTWIIIRAVILSITNLETFPSDHYRGASECAGHGLVKIALMKQGKRLCSQTRLR